MTKTNLIKLENQVISEIARISTQKKFSISSTLFYEGQVPIVAYLLIDGCIKLTKKNKTKKILKPGALIGLNELMTNSPASLSASVQADSILCFLDKSTILEDLKNKDSSLASLFSMELM